MSENERRVYGYASNGVGEQADRPGLERIMAAAARRPRPFDVMMAVCPEVLGTPENVLDFTARLAEHGVEIEYLHPDAEAARMAGAL